MEKKERLIQLKDDADLCILKEFGETEKVSDIMNIYCVKLTDEEVKKVQSLIKCNIEDNAEGYLFNI